jgi:type IV secretory pathway VirB3-like protein
MLRRRNISTVFRYDRFFLHVFADTNELSRLKAETFWGGAETSVSALSQKNRLASAGSGDQLNVTK